MKFPQGFQPIPTYDNYAINKDGDVYSSVSKRLLKPSVSSYIGVTLTNTHSRTVHIHRLLAMTFIPNPENKPQVNHIDGDKHNNSLDNLEWVTQSENAIHSNRVLNNNWYNENSRKAVRGTNIITGATVEFSSLLEATKSGFIGSNIGKCLRGERTHHAKHKWELI